MSDNRNDANLVQEITNLANTRSPVLTGLPNKKTGVLIPEGYHLQTMGEEHPDPTDICEHRAFTEENSFTRYVNRFKNEDTQIFADVERSGVLAILDYHQQDSTPKKALHHAALRIKKSEQWKAWCGINGQLMPQQKFAEFIEENSIDIITPDGATLLEMVSHLKASKNVQFESGKNLQTGETQFIFREEIKGQGAGRKGEITVPDKIELFIPVFFKGEEFSIQAFLRYRIDESSLMFKVDLHRADHVVSDAFDNIISNIGTQTQIEVYHSDL